MSSDVLNKISKGVIQTVSDICGTLTTGQADIQTAHMDPVSNSWGKRPSVVPILQMRKLYLGGSGGTEFAQGCSVGEWRTKVWTRAGAHRLLIPGQCPFPATPGLESSNSPRVINPLSR